MSSTSCWHDYISHAQSSIPRVNVDNYHNKHFTVLSGLCRFFCDGSSLDLPIGYSFPFKRNCFCKQIFITFWAFVFLRLVSLAQRGETQIFPAPEPLGWFKSLTEPVSHGRIKSMSLECALPAFLQHDLQLPPYSHWASRLSCNFCLECEAARKEILTHPSRMSGLTGHIPHDEATSVAVTFFRTTCKTDTRSTLLQTSVTISCLAFISIKPSKLV